MGIAVRFLGVQKWEPKGGRVSYKVWYSTRQDRVGESMTLDDGQEAHLSFYGEKPVKITTTPEGFDSLSQLKPGSVVELDFAPDPNNPRFNVCTGGRPATQSKAA